MSEHEKLHLDKYILNPETLMYEPLERSLKTRFLRTVMVILASVAIAWLYFWIYVSVLGNDSPKLSMLKKNNARWESRLELINHRMDRCEDILGGLELRDEDVYRSIFGLGEISSDLRYGGLDGEASFAALDRNVAGSKLIATSDRLDNLLKAVSVQSKSLDEISMLSKRAGDMASCIPAIPPMDPDPRSYRFTSHFGYRSDPLGGHTAFHSGVDFSMKKGNPVYATGDGVVELVDFKFTGYGNEVIIDHGFGYKTRYAHLSVINVAEGMKLKRGDCIGESGNSGKTSGPHLHYEVHYRGAPINPEPFFDLDMSSEEYKTMVRMRDESSVAVLHKSKRR